MSDINNPDFLSDEKSPIVVEGGLDSLVMEKVTELITLDADIAAASEKLVLLQEKRNTLSEQVIPGLFDDRNISKLCLNSGLTIEIKETIRVSIPKTDPLKASKGYDFLKAHQGEHIIKEEIFIGQYDPKYAELLTENGIPFTVSKEVNAKTLQSWIMGQLGMKKGSLPLIALTDIPPEMSPFLQRETKISKT